MNQWENGSLEGACNPAEKKSCNPAGRLRGSCNPAEKKVETQLKQGSRENGSLIGKNTGKTGVWRVPEILGDHSLIPMTPESKT